MFEGWDKLSGLWNGLGERMDKAYRGKGLALTVDGLGAGMRCLVGGDGLVIGISGLPPSFFDLFLVF